MSAKFFWRVLFRVELLARLGLGAWLLHLSVALAARSSSRMLLALGLFEAMAALLFLWRRTARWGGALLLLSFAFATGFHLRASESAAPLWGYAAAVLALTLASTRPQARPASPLAAAERDFLHAFEATRIAPADFHHRDHIRAAWAMLCSYPLDEALTRYRAALKRLAARAGKPGIYHETITWAYLLIIHERLPERSPDRARERQAPAAGHGSPNELPQDLEFAEFARQNPDLLTFRPSILDEYYPKEILGSEHARRVFILPRPPRIPQLAPTSLAGGPAAASVSP